MSREPSSNGTVNKDYIPCKFDTPHACVLAACVTLVIPQWPENPTT